ncbi:hypothetical protein ACSDR0_24830 [Streptosporangium sp. G11]|uniref:hypothetical protein n=1 Tax=Streptosporangium sp. G11 TaxID=3436926 RepID=UPI003EB6DFC6
MRKAGAGLVAVLILAGCAEAPATAREPAKTRKPAAQRSTKTQKPGASGEPVTRLLDAMAAVSGDGPAAAYFEYGEPARWSELGVTAGSGGAAGRRWLPATAWGFGELAPAAAGLPGVTGVAPLAADRAIAIGVAPGQAFRFDGGAKESVVRSRLEGLGAAPRRIGGHDGLSFAPGADVNPLRPPVPVSGVTNQFNQVVVTGSTVAVAPGTGPLAAVLGGERSLAGSEDHAAVGACLGDVAAATVTASQGSGAVTLYGVGLRRPANLGDRPVNVICVLPRQASVAAVKESFGTRLTTAATSRGGRAFGEFAGEITHDEVRRGDRTVLRATLTLTATPSVLFAAQLLQRGELPFLADPAAPGDPAGLLTATPAPGSPAR